MLPILLLSLAVLVLPPDDLPRVAYPDTGLIAALPPHQFDPGLTTCERRDTADTYWTSCRESAHRTLLLCSWAFAGSPDGVLGDWSAACWQYGGLSSPPFLCRVTIYAFGPSWYACSRQAVPGIPGGNWWGWYPTA